MESKIDFIKNWADNEGWVTTWHLNDNFLDWYEKYYQSQSKNYDKARRSLCYYCRKLVKEGYLEPSKRSGTGESGIGQFGVNYQTCWMKKYEDSDS